MKAVKYNKLPFFLLQAIRELKHEKNSLEARAELLLKAVERQQEQIVALQTELQTVKERLEAADALQVASLEQK